MWYLSRLFRPRVRLAAAVLVAGLFVTLSFSAHVAAGSNPFVPVAQTQPAAPVATVSQCPPDYRTIPTDAGSSVPFICQPLTPAPGQAQPAPGGPQVSTRCSLGAPGVLMCPGPDGQMVPIPVPDAPVSPVKPGCPLDMTDAQCQLDPRYR